MNEQYHAFSALETGEPLLRKALGFLELRCCAPEAPNKIRKPNEDES